MSPARRWPRRKAPKTGLSAIDAQDFDISWSICACPAWTASTAIRHIRARGDAKATVPIIVVTADTALDLRERCLAAGADDVMFKPVAMDALFDAMGRILARDADGGMLV